MRRKIFVFFMFFFCLWLINLFFPLKEKIDGYFLRKEQIPDERPVEYSREKIVYDVKMGMFKLGEATFEYLGKAKFHGRWLEHMTFVTKSADFNDREDIYSDPVTFLPVCIIRDIDGWNIQEKIIETYDQENFLLTITKFKGDKKEEVSLRKDGAIHNAVLLPFYLRRLMELTVGWEMPARLPKQEFKIKLAAKEVVDLPLGVFQTYRFESSPDKFVFWVTADRRRIPVKIKGAGAFGYNLQMRNYERQDTPLVSLSRKKKIKERQR